MSHGHVYSRDIKRDDSPDIYQHMEPTNSRQLRGPGTPGDPPVTSTIDEGIQGPSTTPPTIRPPFPVIAQLDYIVAQFRSRRISKPCAIGLISVTTSSNVQVIGSCLQ